MRREGKGGEQKGEGGIKDVPFKGEERSIELILFHSLQLFEHTHCVISVFIPQKVWIWIFFNNLF